MSAQTDGVTVLVSLWLLAVLAGIALAAYYARAYHTCEQQRERLLDDLRAELRRDADGETIE